MSALAFLLGTTHAVVGSAALVAPYWTTGLFGITPASSTNFVGRLFGCRELLLGASLVYTVHQGRTRGEQALLLTLINLMNATDVVSGLIEHYQGTLSRTGVILGSGGAFGLFCIGMLQASKW